VVPLENAPPLVLIAQPPRSGGSLLAQLLDGHPELHCHPPELMIGSDWPSLDLTQPPRELFRSLGERHLGRFAREGYWKDKPARQLGHSEPESLPFDFDLRRHRTRFIEALGAQPPTTQRQVLDTYFAALFDAWLDNRNPDGQKRWIVAFRGRLRHSLDKFFSDYPDGRHIGVVRDLKGLLASKRARGKTKKSLEKSVERWRGTVETLLASRARNPGQVFVTLFEQLVLDTENETRRIADWLGIEWIPELTHPTFNGYPIKANSTRPVGGHGIRTEVLDNWRHIFSEQEAALLDERTRDLLERAKA
jgi:hypothetical protein